MALSKEDKEIIRNSDIKTYNEWVEFFNNKYTYREIYNCISRVKDLTANKDSGEVLSQRQSNNSRKYNINQDYFKKWSRNMAYIFGFWCADGCIYNGRCFDITLHKKDKYILKKIAEEFKYEGPIYDYVDKQACRINFSCKEMYNDLINLGGEENKSLTLKFPDVPKQYLADFIRGYFDGDGSVYDVQGKRFNTAFCCGSKDFLFTLWDKLKLYVSIKGGSYDEKNYKIVFGKKDSEKIAAFIYKDSPELYLKRKRDVFLKYIQI